MNLRELAAVATLFALLPGFAVGGTLTISAPQVISGASPFAGNGCAIGSPLLDSEHDATLAVDPADAEHLAAIWTQDNTLSSVVGVSTDGGKNWQQSLVPGLSACTGNGRWSTSFDPWISIGPDGVAYMSSVVYAPSVLIGTYGLAVSSSADGGVSWGAARFPIEGPADGMILDKSAVTADANTAERAYVVTTLIPNVLLFSRTMDGGATWSAARPIYAGKPGFSRSAARC